MKEGIKPIAYYPGIFDDFKIVSHIDRWDQFGFPELMWGLGYDMDCEKSFEEYTKASSLVMKKPKNERDKKRNNLYLLENAERQVVGNYLFSHWRYLTHWSYGYDEYDVEYLRRIIRILEDSYPQKAKEKSIEDFVAEINFSEMKLLGEIGTYAFYDEKYTDSNDDTGTPIVIFEDKHTKTFKVCDSDEAFEILSMFSKDTESTVEETEIVTNIKSIRITSNNICYGPVPNASDEVEQFLTITSSGRVWFSARNYQQHCTGKGFCRKKQVNIGKWKAAFLFELIGNLSGETIFATDVGVYDLEIRYSDGTERKITGSLIGGVYSHAYGEEDNVDLTKLIRRFVPVYKLWVFSGSTSPDYEGKKAIFQFADAWEKYFKKPDKSKNFDFDFGNECERLGFQMDTGAKFIGECEKMGYSNPYDEDINKAVDAIEDIDVIGSGSFVYWRGLTHWLLMYQLGEKEREVLMALMRRLKELTGLKK